MRYTAHVDSFLQFVRKNDWRLNIMEQKTLSLKLLQQKLCYNHFEYSDNNWNSPYWRSHQPLCGKCTVSWCYLFTVSNPDLLLFHVGQLVDISAYLCSTFHFHLADKGTFFLCDLELWPWPKNIVPNVHLKSYLVRKSLSGHTDTRTHRRTTALPGHAK